MEAVLLDVEAEKIHQILKAQDFPNFIRFLFLGLKWPLKLVRLAQRLEER